jgi:transcriptional repressor of dcmA and dcmR
MDDANDLLDIGEAAQLLKVSETSLRRWTNAGELQCLRVGNRRERRFRRGDLSAFLERPAPSQSAGPGKQRAGNPQHSVDHAITVTRGNHLCAIYGSEAGRISLFTPFLLEGLGQGSVCHLVAPSASRQEILKNLEDLRPSLTSDMAKGRLVLSEHRESIEAEWEFLDRQLDKAQQEGATSFRVAGDMIDMRARVSPDELIEYEVGLDQKIVSKFPVAILCAYDAREFSGVELLNALKTHRDTFRYPLGRMLG